MGPSKRSRLVKTNPRFNEEWPYKEEKNSTKNKIKKRKLSEMLGSKWTKQELQCFYESYRKFGTNWGKVAEKLHNRSLCAVEALYNMNKAYLSLPDGTATAAGLIAMMTDHCDILDGSINDSEIKQIVTKSQKPQKRSRGKSHWETPEGSRELDSFQNKSTATSGCMSLIRKDPFYINRARVVGKRTPRFPVSLFSDTNASGAMASNEDQTSETKKEASKDDGVHVAALTLAGVSNRSGNSHTVTQKHATPLLMCEMKHAEVQMDAVDRTSSGMNTTPLDASTETNGVSKKDYTLDDTGGSFTNEIQMGVPKSQRKLENLELPVGHLDATGQHFTGAEDAFRDSDSICKGEVNDREESNIPVMQVSKKKPIHTFSEDERSVLDALQALAGASPDVSLSDRMLPSEPRSHFKKSEVIDRKHLKSSCRDGPNHSCKRVSKPETSITNAQKALCGSKQKSNKTKRKRASLHENVQKAEEIVESILCENDEAKVKEKLDISPSNVKEKLTSRLFESSKPDSSSNHLKMPIGTRSRYKLNLKKEMARKLSVRLGDEYEKSDPVNPKVNNVQGTLSNCLSSQLLRKWCISEWFYGSIDYPWFARIDFVEYLNHVRLGHVPRLTRTEWSIIRSSLGRPRRLSRQFLLEERAKLDQYRESVRTHYAEVRHDPSKGLPTDLARPLSVGQRVIALHPQTREIHDGSILTVDRSHYRVQFDRPPLGVYCVMDIDCMPVNPLETLPDDLRRQNALDKLYKSSVDAKADAPYLDWKEEKLLVALNENSVNAYVTSFTDSRQLNTSHANVTTCAGSIGNSGISASFRMHDLYNETESNILEIVESSRRKATEMVDFALQALYSFKSWENSLTKGEKVVGLKNYHINGVSSGQNDKKNIHHPGLNGSATQNEEMARVFSPPTTCADYPQVPMSSDENSGEMLSKLISTCVSALLMIQACTEGRCPPAEIARILELACASLQPSCSQNLPIYRDIETCIGMIKSQMLSLVPVPSLS